MPDVDAEWARFEREVINKAAKPRTRLIAAWIGGIGVAATVALLLVMNTSNELIDASSSSQPVDAPLQQQSADPEIVQSSTDLPSGHTMRLEPPCPGYSDTLLQGKIAGLDKHHDSDIRRLKNDYRRPVNEQIQATTLTLVNGKEDETFVQYLRELPYWSMTFIYDYFFQRNQLFMGQKVSEGAEASNYASLFNGRSITVVVDYQTKPYTPVSQFTSEELKARRLKYLLRCYQEGKDIQDYSGMLAPDLFDSPAKELFFGFLKAKYAKRGNKDERFGLVSHDSRGTYIPLEHYVNIKVQDEIWEENGEWIGIENDKRFNAVISDIEQAATRATSSLVESGDSIVKMAFIYGGKVTKGEPHESEISDKRLYEKVKESTFEFTPDEDVSSYWSAEIYYSTHFPRHMDILLKSVDKLYATDCPDILNIHYKHLTGVVQDEEGNPLPHAIVSNRDRPYFSQGVSTDSLGRFELMLPNRCDSIRVMRIGYNTKTIRVLPTDSILTIPMKRIDYKALRRKQGP